MASQFAGISDFGMNIPGVWEQDALVWDYKKVWMDKKALKGYIEQFQKDKSTPEVKGKTNPITWLVTDSQQSF